MFILDFEKIKILLTIIVSFLLIGFCILDGFDIGICILIPFIGKDDIDKRIMINSIAPNWDGNQVWLVTLIGLIFSAWPLVYFTILNCLYILIIFMLIFLILRPICLDFRSKISNLIYKKICDIILFFSSFFIIFIIGIIIGIIIKGIPFYFDKYIILYNINFNISFFEILIGILFIINSLIQGSIYLQIKTKDEIYNISNKITNILIFFQLFLIFIILNILFNKIHGYILLNNFFNKFIVLKSIGLYKFNYIKYPLLIIFIIFNFIFPIFTLIFNIFKYNLISFIFSSLTILSFIISIIISIFPFIIISNYNPIFNLTIWNSTSSEKTLNIIVLFILLIIPIIILYTIFAYKKMGGKIDRSFIKINKHILY